jgi:hypothetical protein
MGPHSLKFSVECSHDEQLSLSLKVKMFPGAVRVQYGQPPCYRGITATQKYVK